ncbi:MAG: nucleotidyl transferase AbiEii/AbiGii toxin family protein [Lachnospiraceae bacterium]|nr:nucleotidyl transferase AbiEii/AbiGii toxin family protein [Lachnospiraceae bacterium]
MDLQKMMDRYYEEGLSRELAAARVCQDIVLKAIAIGPLNRNVTIKGGVVMRNLTNNNRRATRDIDLDFIHHSIADDAIRVFVQKMNCIPEIKIEIIGDIEELKHQDYHGKSIKVRITDKEGTAVESKIDIGVHKQLELEQEEYCFDVCMDEKGASLLKNSNEQSVVEKLRALLIFGVNNRRYKDIYDVYYLKNHINRDKLVRYIDLLIFKDELMRENRMKDIIDRLESCFKDQNFLYRISTSRQRWMDEDIEVIAKGIVTFFNDLR